MHQFLNSCLKPKPPEVFTDSESRLSLVTGLIKKDETRLLIESYIIEMYLSKQKHTNSLTKKSKTIYTPTRYIK